MLEDPLFFLMIVAVAIVAGILVIGIGSFGRGGENAAKRSNKYMQYRIIAQFIAICLIGLFVYLRGGS